MYFRIKCQAVIEAAQKSGTAEHIFNWGGPGACPPGKFLKYMLSGRLKMHPSVPDAVYFLFLMRVIITGEIEM